MAQFCLLKITCGLGFASLLIFFAEVSRSRSQVQIMTSGPEPQILLDENLLYCGKIVAACFTGPNKKTWNYSIAVFDVNESLRDELEKKGKVVEFNGPNGVRLNFTGNVTIAATLNLSGVRESDTSNTDSMFRLGGFVRKNSSCCALGAGPGAAYSYHGGGSGGKGGGYYQDRNSTRYYGWDYASVYDLLGGSTGTALFSPDVGGAGGGAIEIISSGKITIEESGKIIANGYSTGNTTKKDCAGGSAGGIIRLRATEVSVKGTLSAHGGNSGYSTNISSFCGGGGGGGIIQIFTLTNSTVENYNLNSSLRTRGGRGRDDGEDGIDYAGVFFDGNNKLVVNTTSCQMKWHGKVEKSYQGALEQPGDSVVCRIEIDASIYITENVNVHLTGNNALILASRNGNIDLYSDLIMDNDNGSSLGGYSGSNKGPQKRCTDNKMLEDFEFDHLIGGSICQGSPGVGGGAIELSAKKGKVTVGAGISMDAKCSISECYAMGGLIRLRGKNVSLGSKALLSASGGKTNGGKRTGGVIQILSEYDVEGFCEEKFSKNMTMEEPLRIVRVSSEKSYQVQYIIEGELTIDTSKSLWTHVRNLTDPNFVFCYKGKKVSKQLHDPTNQSTINYTIALFEWQVPILINGSAVVKVFGKNSLHLHSKEGMFLGANFSLVPKACEEKFIGGFCKCNSSGNKSYGPGGAEEHSDGGAGHGGKGGSFIVKDNLKFGWSYGFEENSEPDLIGGSTGSAPGTRGCGGGAIKISSDKSITIGGKLDVSGMYNGSSGGTIILDATQVNFTNQGSALEARGADGGKGRGGGAGGIIYINRTDRDSAKELLKGMVKGGSWLKSGENGFVIINGIKIQEYPNNVPQEELSNDTIAIGCVKILRAVNNYSVTLLEHEVLPSKCREKCNKTTIAVIRKKECYCLSPDDGLDLNNTSHNCSERCLGNYIYQCGGEELYIYNAYKADFFNTTEEVNNTKIANKDSLSKKLEQLENSSQNATNETIIKVVTILKTLVETSKKMNKRETSIVLNVLKVVAYKSDIVPTKPDKIQELGKVCLDVADSLLDPELKESYGVQNADGSKESEVKVTSPNQVLQIVEKIGVNLGSNLAADAKFVLETKKIGMGVEKMSLENAEEKTLPDYTELKRWKSGNQVRIPKQVFTQQLEEGEDTLVLCYVLYENVSDVLNANHSNSQRNEDWQIGSLVMAVSTSGKLPSVLLQPITISLETKVLDKIRKCKFLNFSEIATGEWSSNGCTTYNGKGNITECVCNHLTNFAILMQVNDFRVPRKHQEALSFITYVGCGISLFALALTLATFLSLETLASERTSIHKNLVVAIGLAQILFLAGIDAVSNYIVCTMVAIFLHYLYIAAFTWMLAEGIHLYTKVVEVFSEGSKMKFYYAIGWALPAIIVLISASARIEGYGTEMACWISRHHGLIWAFVTPVLVIIVINLFVLIMVIRVILASVTSLQSDGNTSKVKAGVKGMIVLLPLLGITWVFGLLAIDERTIAFQYIFAILNSLQGLFIFAFHCVGNTEVRIAYKRLHEKRTLAKSLPDHSMSSVAHDSRQGSSKEKSRRQNSRETIDDDIIITKAIRSVSDVKLNDQFHMQTFGDADSGRWSLNCPSPDPSAQVDTHILLGQSTKRSESRMKLSKA